MLFAFFRQQGSADLLSDPLRCSPHLARRLNVRQSTVAKLEKSEAEDTISLQSLRKAAEALDCTLLYAFVPRASLDAYVQTQAHLRAKEIVERVDHTMSLEAQGGQPGGESAADRGTRGRDGAHHESGTVGGDAVRFDYPEGATPLDPETMAGLIPNLTTQGELNEFEARNIALKQRWVLGARGDNRDMLLVTTLGPNPSSLQRAAK